MAKSLASGHAMLETTVAIKILKLSYIGLVLYLDGETAWELLVLLVWV